METKTGGMSPLQNVDCWVWGEPPKAGGRAKPCPRGPSPCPEAKGFERQRGAEAPADGG